MDSIIRTTPIFSPITSSLVVGTFIILLLFFALTSSQLKYIFRPGPWGIPLLGYYPFLPKIKTHLKLGELAKKYGDAYLINLCGTIYVHISSLSALKEAFVTKSDYFIVRPRGSIVMDALKDGVFAANGEAWRVWRKFVTQSMREIGLGSREQLKNPMQEAIESTLEEIKRNEGEITNITLLLIPQCTEVIRRLMIGDNATKTTSEKFNQTFRKFITTVSSFESLLSGKIARYVAKYKVDGIPEMHEVKAEMYRIFDDLIRDHERRFDLADPKDIVDLFLRERKQRTSKGDPQAKYFTNEAFANSMIQIYGDSGYSVGASLSAIIGKLAKVPGVQESMFLEISDNIGTERLPTYEDLLKLPYTNSVIKEIQRQSDEFTIFPNLECSVSTTISGVHVPKGAIALVNMYAINNNDAVYKNPENFDPERFLSPEGIERKKENHPLIFGIGKRACLGEMLVLTEIFLFTTAIIQKFKLELPNVKQNSRAMEDFKNNDQSSVLDGYHIIARSRTLH